MRNELEIKKHIAKINFITQLERIVYILRCLMALQSYILTCSILRASLKKIAVKNIRRK